jgi:hypothetical protein
MFSANTVGQSTSGNLINDGTVDTSSTDGTKKRRRRRGFQCPYHGWEFNVDWQLIKATNMKGIENFSPKDYGLTSTPVQQFGPVVFLNFGGASGKKRQQTGEKAATEHMTALVQQEMAFLANRQLFANRLEESGFPGDFGDLELVETREYTVTGRYFVTITAMAATTAGMHAKTWP